MNTISETNNDIQELVNVIAITHGMILDHLFEDITDDWGCINYFETP
jgi:hypothetical protein